MTKPILFVPVGLPAAGKSRWSQDQVTLSRGRTKRVNRDSLRLMVDPNWSQDKEKAITAGRDALIMTWIKAGFNVIVDDTNLSPKVQAHLKGLIFGLDVDFKLVDFTDVSVEDCIKRDLGRPGAVGQNVILKMYYKYLCAPSVKDIQGKRNTIICDIDGTIAKAVNRGPFEEDKVYEDEVRQSVLRTVRALSLDTGADITFLSGRQDSCRDRTILWLLEKAKMVVKRPDFLHMRAAGDRRPDYIVKTELYKKHIEGEYNVIAVFDDRPQVIRSCWEKLGLGDRLFRCGETMREF